MLKYSLIFISIIALSSCGSNETQTTESPKVDSTVNLPDSAPTTSPENGLAEFKFTMLMSNISSPFESISLLSKSNIPYNSKLINAVENLKKYSSSHKKGLNYGAYVVDMVYLSTNEQYAQIKPYFKTARTLAQSLECGDSFDKLSGSRLEENLDKKDTIDVIMDKLFVEMDSYLRSNDRVLTATQILVGSWIESQFITLSTIKDVPSTKENEILGQKVAQQKQTLVKLSELLQEFKNEKNMIPMIDGINQLKDLYSKEIKSDTVDNATLNKLYTSVSNLRIMMIN